MAFSLLEFATRKNNMTIRKNRRYIMLISTQSPSWDSEAENIRKTLEKENIEIVKIIPMNKFNGVDFIGIGEDRKK